MIKFDLLCPISLRFCFFIFLNSPVGVTIKVTNKITIDVGAVRLAVFVDPNDDNVDYWQPALVSSFIHDFLKIFPLVIHLNFSLQVVPTIEWNWFVKKIKPGEVVIRYFSEPKP